MKHSRDRTIDALRGVAILGMVLVNLQGSPNPFPLLDHAEWNGLTIADLVFPLFLFTAGLTVALVQDRMAERVPLRRIVQRGAMLFVIGVAIGWVIRPSFDPAQIRVAGVLQRIGIAYVVAAAIAGQWRDGRIPAAIAGVLLALHAALIFVSVGGVDSLTMTGGLNGWLDQHFLPGKMWRVGYDPEGILSTLSAIANALIGVATYRFVQRSKAPLRALAVVAALMFIVGVAATNWLPLNKNLWTPSFALVTAGVGAALWAGLRLSWPRIGATRAAASLATIGTVALTLYVVHMLMIAVLVRHIPGGARLWGASFDALHRALPMSEGWASVVYAALAGALAILLTEALRRRGWVLRV